VPRAQKNEKPETKNAKREFRRKKEKSPLGEEVKEIKLLHRGLGGTQEWGRVS